MRPNLGKIAQSLVGQREKTEFEKGLAGYGFLLMRILFILAPLMFFAHVFLAHNILESLLFVLALAVGFAPELLPLIVTINLSERRPPHVQKRCHRQISAGN